MGKYVRVIDVASTYYVLIVGVINAVKKKPSPSTSVPTLRYITKNTAVAATMI